MIMRPKCLLSITTAPTTIKNMPATIKHTPTNDSMKCNASPNRMYFNGSSEVYATVCMDWIESKSLDITNGRVRKEQVKIKLRNVR